MDGDGAEGARRGDGGVGRKRRVALRIWRNPGAGAEDDDETTETGSGGRARAGAEARCVAHCGWFCLRSASFVWGSLRKIHWVRRVYRRPIMSRQRGWPWLVGGQWLLAARALR